MLSRRLTPRVALLTCSVFVFLLEAAQGPNAAAAQEVQEATAEAGGVRLTRAKRQLIGTPSIPLVDPKRKRPFCNAFTGCGKKRSEGQALRALPPAGDGGGVPAGVDAGDEGAEESMATLVELNSEPAVAELSRQILSEAKLWEAIQEASQELARRRQQQAMFERQQQSQRMAERRPRARQQQSEYEMEAIRKRRAAPPPIPKGTLPSAGDGALPIV